MSEETASVGGSKNPFLTLLLLLNTLVIGLIGFFFFKQHKQMSSQLTVTDLVKAGDVDEEPDASGMAKEEDGILFPLEAFTTNLAPSESGPRRFVWLSAVLKFSKTSLEEEFKSRGPQIRDAIISTLNSKKPEDLLKVEGKNYLKEEIKAAINSFLVDGTVIDVYYIGFKVN